MSDPYIGEIRMFAGNFAPQDWLFCQGQLISIPENPTLFQLIGTTYGGDGQTNFALPNLQSRLAIDQGPDGQGNTYALGQTGGAEQVTVILNQLPSHTHLVSANGNTNSGASTNGAGSFFGSPNKGDAVYGTSGTQTALSPKAVSISIGGTQAHSNIKPYQCVNFIICLNGIYPTQN